jgi:hypothetical protein
VDGLRGAAGERGDIVSAQATGLDLSLDAGALDHRAGSELAP